MLNIEKYKDFIKENTMEHIMINEDPRTGEIKLVNKISQCYANGDCERCKFCQDSYSSCEPFIIDFLCKEAKIELSSDFHTLCKLIKARGYNYICAELYADEDKGIDTPEEVYLLACKAKPYHDKNGWWRCHDSEDFLELWKLVSYNDAEFFRKKTSDWFYTEDFLTEEASICE